MKNKGLNVLSLFDGIACAKFALIYFNCLCYNITKLDYHKGYAMSNNISTLGFNGEYLDDTLDNYHLGNGYRAYNPSIMQFTAPDDMSPFGHGGINPYVYCSGDPINNSDPTGHFLGFAGVLLSMLMPINLPHGTGIGAIIETVEENAINVGIDEGIDAVIGLISAGTAAPATPALNAMVATVEHLAERPVEREARQGAEDYLTSAAGSSRGTARQELSTVSEKTAQARRTLTKRAPYTTSSEIDKRLEEAYKAAVKRDNGETWLETDTFGGVPTKEFWAPSNATRDIIRKNLRKDFNYTARGNYFISRGWTHVGNISDTVSPNELMLYRDGWGGHYKRSIVFMRGWPPKEGGSFDYYKILNIPRRPPFYP